MSVSSYLKYFSTVKAGIAASLVSLMLAAPVWAQQQGAMIREVPMRILTVTGRGVEEIPATIAQVRLGVEVQGKTAAEVQQEAARRVDAVVKLLRSRGVEKLQTSGISLNPVYSYENNMQRLSGYIATNTVSFRQEAEKTGSLLDEAVKAGATRIDGISFVAAETAIAQAQQQALREATEEAQKQAAAVLSALNLTKQEIIGIQISGAYAPPILFSVVNERAADKAPSTPVIGGQQQVEATVTLQIRY
ncbi:MAG TPA: SIMPL domain-containing protein [Oscillatoriaceae cyanobacterium M7585_C2015_266]|nr:SIMPL domain-containing protein [Oscillatoriaceae cyanobacterium M7585_C2015_266]